MNLSQVLLVSVVLAPGLIFALLSLSWLLGWTPGERAISRVTGIVFSLSTLGLAGLLWPLAANGSATVAVTFGNWFAVHETGGTAHARLTVGSGSARSVYGPRLTYQAFRQPPGVQRW